MDLFHHPAFQSFVLPVLLALLGVGVLKLLLGAEGPRWAPVAAVLALLVALAVLPGYALPASSTPQKLPWIVLAATVLAVALEALHARRWSQALAAGVLWLGASVWLAPSAARGTLPHLAQALGGLAVIGCVALTSWRPADQDGRSAAGPATLAVAGLGLAALAAGASLLLAQLAVMLPAVCAGLGLWLWPRMRVAFGPVAAMPLTLAWLALAQIALQLAGVPPVALGVLALAFAAAPLLGRLRLPGSPAVVEPLAVAALAAVPVALAVAWSQSAGPPAPANASEDPYYAPQWK